MNWFAKLLLVLSFLLASMAALVTTQFIKIMIDTSEPVTPIPTEVLLVLFPIQILVTVPYVIASWRYRFQNADFYNYFSFFYICAYLFVLGLNFYFFCALSRGDIFTVE